MPIWKPPDFVKIQNRNFFFLIFSWIFLNVSYSFLLFVIFVRIKVFLFSYFSLSSTFFFSFFPQTTSFGPTTGLQIGFLFSSFILFFLGFVQIYSPRRKTRDFCQFGNHQILSNSRIGNFFLVFFLI